MSDRLADSASAPVPHPPPPNAPPAARAQSLAQLAQGPRWRTEAMRAHRQPVLYWFTRGQGRMTVQGVTRGWGPHNAVFLPPATMHGFEVVGHLSGTALFLPHAQAAELPETALHLRLREAPLQTEMSIQIDNIARELGRGADRSERALAHHVGLLAVWFDRQIDRNPASGDPFAGRAAERIAGAFTALLERDFRRGRTIADYAADLGVTATHLSRACKAACGRSGSALLQDRLFFEARRMLRETDMPIKDVAASLGFRSPAYFTRAFTGRTGRTPSDFRRKG